MSYHPLYTHKSENTHHFDYIRNKRLHQRLMCQIELILGAFYFIKKGQKQKAATTSITFNPFISLSDYHLFELYGHVLVCSWDLSWHRRVLALDGAVCRSGGAWLGPNGCCRCQSIFHALSRWRLVLCLMKHEQNKQEYWSFPPMGNAWSRWSRS